MILGLVGLGCDDPEELSQSDDIELCPSEPASDPIDVESLAIVDGKLEVSVSYGGGCEEHIVNACWDQSFAAGEPVQAQVWLTHHAMGDICKVGITQSRVFDLSELEETWIEAYQSQHGTIEIHVGAQSIAHEF